MRKLYTCLLIIGFLGFINTATFANNKSTANLNERLKSLQNRLLKFNKNTLSKAIDTIDESTFSPITTVVYDSVLTISEEFLDEAQLVELDSELGADLTVLFHDAEFFEEMKKQESLQSTAEVSNETGQFINNEEKYIDITTHRQVRYEDLRRRFMMACSSN